MHRFSELIEKTTEFNVRDDLKHLTADEIRIEQARISKPWAVMLLNVTGDFNTGVILRTACAFGAKAVYIVGRKKYDKRTAVGVHHYFQTYSISGFQDFGTEPNREIVRKTLEDNKLCPIFIEQGGLSVEDPAIWDNRIKAIRLRDMIPTLVVGNEGLGIPDDILELGRLIPNSFQVSIKQIGITRSLNVSTAFGIVAHTMSQRMGWL